MGDYKWDDTQIKILHAGIDLGMNLIDTAEAYNEGRSEEIIGKAIRNKRKKVIIGTKFSPEHSSYNDVLKAAEGSLRRLNTDYIDIYQTHWPNPKIPFDETLAAMEKLVEQGKVRYIGLGNVHLEKLKESQSILRTKQIVSIQAEYNLFDRTIENDIIPFCEQNHITVLAYTPLDHGRIIDGKKPKAFLGNIAKKYGKTPAQITLRWLVEKPQVIVITKTACLKHIQENASSMDFDLEQIDIDLIDNISKKQCINVDTERIQVSPFGEGNRKVYRTLEEAIENKLGYVPSPLDLAESIQKEKTIKPVRLIQARDKNSKYCYDLIEGRIRYWAWVIAFIDNVPIPAIIRKQQ